jgi:hypothetical protein
MITKMTMLRREKKKEAKKMWTAPNGPVFEKDGIRTICQRTSANSEKMAFFVHGFRKSFKYVHGPTKVPKVEDRKPCGRRNPSRTRWCGLPDGLSNRPMTKFEKND